MRPAHFLPALCATLAFATRLFAQTAGTIDPDFNVTFSNSRSVTSLAILPGDAILVATVAHPNAYLERVHRNGALDTDFGAFSVSSTYPQMFTPRFESVAVQQDGKILLGGVYFSSPSPPVRLHSNGMLDTGFLSAEPQCHGIALQRDGKILSFTSYLFRLNTDGSREKAFSPAFYDMAYINAAAVQEDGKIVVVGNFPHVQFVSRTGVARLYPDGGLDLGFNPVLSGSSWPYVYTVALQPDGKTLIGGQFSAVNGQNRNGIARLNPDGTLDDTFAPDLGPPIANIVLQADGKILVPHEFTESNGEVRRRVTRINPNGTLDTTFAAILSEVGTITSITLQSDGRLLLGGTRLVRLLNDPAIQSLVVPDSTVVEWHRGGSAPEVGLVAFDLSTDGGANWLPLGAGTRMAGGWVCSGLNLPPSGLIRARGRPTGGYHSRSSGIVEQLTSFPFGSPFARWKLARLGNANAPNGGDTDFDGLRTILEYPTGADPKVHTELPAARMLGNRLALTFSRSVEATDVALTVQGSDDLSTWTDLARSIGGAAMVPLVAGVSVAETGSGLLRTVEVRDLYLTTDPAHPRRFLRLHAAPESGAVLPYALRPRHRRASR